MSTIIEIEDLTKIYTPRRRGVRPIVAVDHVSFDVQAGQTFGFLGPNGAGKTTTIRMCTGIIRPTSGRIVVAGSGMVADPIRVKERIGVVSDATSLYNEMSAWENLRFLLAFMVFRLKSGQCRQSDCCGSSGCTTGVTAV